MGIAGVLGGITKHGDRYLRCLLTHGARAVLISAQRQRSRAQPLSRLHHWAVTLRDRRGHNKATIAVANKLGPPGLGGLGQRCPLYHAPRRVTTVSPHLPEMLSE